MSFDATDPRQRAAVHETGHALMALIGGLQFRHVTIAPVGVTLGQGYTLGGAVVFDQNPIAADDHDRWLRTMWAGMAAEMLMLGTEPDPVSFFLDSQEITRIMEARVPADRRNEYSRNIFAQTRAALEKSLPALERIASRLFEAETLTHAEVVALGPSATEERGLV